jgi:hypothetical protein
MREAPDSRKAFSAISTMPRAIDISCIIPLRFSVNKNTDNGYRSQYHWNQMIRRSQVMEKLAAMAYSVPAMGKKGNGQ